jgi:hypothetical protein
MRDGTLFIRRWSWVSVFYWDTFYRKRLAIVFREYKDQWALTGADQSYFKRNVG